LRLVNSSYDEAPLREALANFDRAIALDSGFAAAHSGRATAWLWLADGFALPLEAYGNVRYSANRALAHDSNQATAYANLALAVQALDLDAHEAERLVRRAVALDPRGGYPRQILGQILFSLGRDDEATAEGRRGWELDSLLAANGALYGEMLIYQDQLDSAAAFLRRFRAISAADADADEGLLMAKRGDWRSVRRLLGWRYYGGLRAGLYVHALVALGDTVAARATVDSMLAERASPRYYNPMALARAYAVLGDVDRGIEWLQRSLAERTVWFPQWVRFDLELNPLRADPRFAAIERQLRF
jgi:tetratricopeptide (TPR) repeat protein